MNYILLTQSRALVDGGTSWLRAKLHSLYYSQQQEFVVITGDASSDQIAIESLESAAVDYRYKMFGLGGRIKAVQRINGVVTTYWSRWMSADEVKSISPKRIPLVRNQHMVDHCPVSAKCYGYIAKWSRTLGTQHTLRLARERGMEVEEHYLDSPFGANVL